MNPPANDDEPARLHINAADLAAYARGELDVAERRRVEGFLACNPDLAARMMHELHLRGRAARHERRRGGPLAAILLVCAGVGVTASWFPARAQAHWREADGDAAPAYIQEAVESQEATMMRAAMASQPSETRLDESEIQKAMRIDLPRIPAGWRVLDVQVYPSDQGPGVQLWLEPPGGRRISLFAVNSDTRAGARPQYASNGAKGAVFWEVGRSAFVLLGDGPQSDLLREAALLLGEGRS